MLNPKEKTAPGFLSDCVVPPSFSKYIPTTFYDEQQEIETLFPGMKVTQSKSKYSKDFILPELNFDD